VRINRQAEARRAYVARRLAADDTFDPSGTPQAEELSIIRGDSNHGIFSTTAQPPYSTPIDTVHLQPC
jgi:hypothetical protein